MAETRFKGSDYGFFTHFVRLVVILKSFEHGMDAGSAAPIIPTQPNLTTLLAPLEIGEKNNRSQTCTNMNFITIG